MTRFIKISNPVGFRINLLESSKKIVHNMQFYREFYTLRKKKLELIEELRSDFKEITFLLQKLYEELPDKDILQEYEKRGIGRKSVTKEKPEEEPAEEESVAIEKVSKDSEELERLASILDNIESKLNKLK